jgi:hypothetical protein
MNLHDFFKKLNYTLNEETAGYLSSLSEVKLKLLIKRVYENNEFIRTELNKQVKLTEYKNIQEVVSSLNRDQTEEFIYWMAESIFGSEEYVENELEKILVE